MKAQGTSLREDFAESVWARVPHWVESGGERFIVNATPMVEITGALRECFRELYSTELRAGVTVLGKFESALLTGSVKMRAASRILAKAIDSGKLRKGQVIFEATSGNFGIALSVVRSLGLDLVVLVSRKLEPGVIEALKQSGAYIVDLDIDICPAPGLRVDPDTARAKGVAESLKQQLLAFGLPAGPFEEEREEVEVLLARQDVINLAKLLAKAYNGFCPEQYDNEENAGVHEQVTGPEIEQQLRALNLSIEDCDVVCCFGTGGTSTGLARYLSGRLGRNAVHVVFPKPWQDVAGIRTKAKAEGLSFYRPELYASELELDFQEARKMIDFFDSRGFSIGESSALALYGVMQLAELNPGRKFVVILADDSKKYKLDSEERLEVSLHEVASNPSSYSRIVWAHTSLVPKEEGVAVIAEAVGRRREDVKILGTDDVRALLSDDRIPRSVDELLGKERGKVLLVCMAGGTSLAAAKVLKKRGIEAVSLEGGIIGVALSKGVRPIELVEYGN